MNTNYLFAATTNYKIICNTENYIILCTDMYESNVTLHHKTTKKSPDMDF